MDWKMCVGGPKPEAINSYTKIVRAIQLHPELKIQPFNSTRKAHTQPRNQISLISQNKKHQNQTDQNRAYP